MKKKLSLALFIIFCFTKLNAQITKAKPEEYKEIFNRTLAVEVLEENKKYTDKIEKSKNEEDKKELENYRHFINVYNTSMKRVIDSVWKLNKKVEYKTTSEIEKIRSTKNKKYACLFYSQSKHLRDPEQTFDELEIPTLNYNRAENKLYQADYTFFLPAAIESKQDIFFDILFSINFIKKNINDNINSNKNNTAKEFIQSQSELNCGKLSSKTLLVNKTLFEEKKFDENEVKNAYKQSLIISETANEVNKKLAQEPGKYLFLVALPYGVLKKTGIISVERKQYQRCIADIDGNVYGAIGAGFGQIYLATFRAKDLSKISNCK